MFTAGIRAHLLTSRLAAPLLLESDAALLVNTTFWDQDKYLGNLFYDVAKSAINRMVYGMAIELQDHGVVAVAVSPGFMRTERVMENSPEHLERSESPEYIGRAVRALAADDTIMDRTGRVLTVGDFASEYDFTDIDGTQHPPFDIDGK